MERNLLIVTLTALAAVLLYVVSAGPVFAYIQKPSVCGGYRLLFRVAPALTAKYVNCWGVSDVEVFFLLEPAQRNRDRY